MRGSNLKGKKMLALKKGTPGKNRIKEETSFGGWSRMTSEVLKERRVGNGEVFYSSKKNFQKGNRNPRDRRTYRGERTAQKKGGTF